jgi:hypothetical protein
MAWRCSGRTNAELISNMLKNGIFTSQRVGEAMARVDRANYVLDKSSAYMDSPQSIRYDATISAPHMVCDPFSAQTNTSYLSFGEACSRSGASLALS